MRAILLFVALLFSTMTQARQLDFDFGEHPAEVLKKAHFLNNNVKVTSDVPEKILKIWYYRDFGFEIADGYYGYGPKAYYKIYDSKQKLIGYMMAQTLSYSEDPEYHIAYTVCDLKGKTHVELEYDVYDRSDRDSLPSELRPAVEDDEE